MFHVQEYIRFGRHENCISFENDSEKGNVKNHGGAIIFKGLHLPPVVMNYPVYILQ